MKSRLTTAYSETSSRAYGTTGLLSRRVGSTSTFYAYDPQGSVAARVNRSGTVVSSDLYDAYGGLRAGNPNSDPVGYNGQWGYHTDPTTGYVLCTLRWYDPTTARWLTRDPIGYSGGMNLYGYLGGNPVNWVDPLGLEQCRIVVPPGGPNGLTGAHVYIRLDYIGKNQGGVWYGFYPVDPSQRRGSLGSSSGGHGPGVVVCGDDPGLRPGVPLPGGWHEKTLQITPEQAKAIYSAIVGPHPEYDLDRYNCSTWAADVLRPAFPEVPDGIRTPYQLMSCFTAGAAG